VPAVKCPCPERDWPQWRKGEEHRNYRPLAGGRVHSFTDRSDSPAPRATCVVLRLMVCTQAMMCPQRCENKKRNTHGRQCVPPKGPHPAPLERKRCSLGKDKKSLSPNNLQSMCGSAQKPDACVCTVAGHVRVTGHHRDNGPYASGAGRRARSAWDFEGEEVRAAGGAGAGVAEGG
jgi:hypothetical protein